MPAVRRPPTTPRSTLAPSSVRKTERFWTESNQSTSVQNWAISDAAMPTTTSTSSVVTSGLRRRSRVAVRCPPPVPLPCPAGSGSSPNQSRSLTVEPDLSAVVQHAYPQHADRGTASIRIPQRPARPPVPGPQRLVAESLPRSQVAVVRGGAPCEDAARDLSPPAGAGPALDRRSRHRAPRGRGGLGPAAAALRAGPDGDPGGAGAAAAGPAVRGRPGARRADGDRAGGAAPVLEPRVGPGPDRVARGRRRLRLRGGTRRGAAGRRARPAERPGRRGRGAGPASRPPGRPAARRRAARRSVGMPDPPARARRRRRGRRPAPTWPRDWWPPCGRPSTTERRRAYAGGMRVSRPAGSSGRRPRSGRARPWRRRRWRP